MSCFLFGLGFVIVAFIVGRESGYMAGYKKGHNVGARDALDWVKEQLR